ncbi:hypothetical protein FNV43_RR04063 [Rhamnella rubrinervis]|uniref:Phytocyanin domain-containing protein n=1 Tax=Rhamnella rubrinervis TaxID=2594499 RepID=A0A8K0MPF7_9ROSA|nr:hypothetical protein FNV43_RR04063 [Rhamnella rubrinervis]
MKMDSSYGAKWFVLLMAASLLAVCQAETIVVGGSEGWRFGFNYTDWAIQNSPFYINDKLVFKYDPPSNSTSAYNIYLLPYLLSFTECDLSNAELLANSTQGGGKGFEVVLDQWRPYYFASGGDDGYHCKDGLMKFFAVPWPHE